MKGLFRKAAMVRPLSAAMQATLPSELRFSAIVDSMVNLQKQELSFSQFKEMTPMADELTHYLESCEDRQEVFQASHIKNLVEYGLSFN